MKRSSKDVDSLTPEQLSPLESIPPDGGLKAWSSVVGTIVCQFCSFGLINALGSFQYEYETSILRDSSMFSISWILTFQLFLMFFLSQPVGVLVDIVGPRLVLAPAAVFLVVGLVTLSFCTKYYQIFLAQSVCFGIGAAGVFVPGFVTTGQYFKRKRALALGVAAVGSSIGGTIFPIFFARLFNQIGFASTIRWTALMAGILLTIAIPLVTPLNKPKGWAKGRRSFLGMVAFKEMDFCIYVAGAFLFFWGLFGPFNFLPAFASQDAATSGVALYTVSILNAASIPGRIIPSYFSDRLGHLATMTIMGYVAGISVLAIWLPISYHHSLAGLIIFALVFGFSSGAFVSLMTASLVDICGGHVHNLGMMLGTYFCTISFAYVILLCNRPLALPGACYGVHLEEAALMDTLGSNSSLTGLPIQGAISNNPSGSLTGLIAFSGSAMVLGSVILNIAWNRSAAKMKARKAKESDQDKVFGA
ncbi:hypothetical protein MMC17_004608 [Xylographa soralifera]|nr:hypothetical protein [Xylographa soralifera]